MTIVQTMDEHNRFQNILEIFPATAEGWWEYDYKKDGNRVKTDYRDKNIFHADRTQIPDILIGLGLSRGKWYRVHTVNSNKVSLTLFNGKL